MGVILGVASGCTTAATLDPTPSAVAVLPLNSEKYASVVVDGSTGVVLYSANADLPRIPASLTKMMTLYLTFEALQSGRITKSTLIPMSAHAASQAPSKLGVRPGQAIDVDTAIKAIVVKSANDVAVALAEYLGGSEEQFAALMTEKARRLGMKGTNFHNASGLPDPQQITTARDMALLGLALRRHYPGQYYYFAVHEFAFNGKLIRGHNRVLDQVNGADGIKTGYVRASGFNIVTSVSDNGRQLVAVVMGGDTARSRDAQVVNLVNQYLPQVASR
ncbi:D-alanyl-D-alanine carboxypeptidase [Phyllobacterium sp. YR620]|uniref:D-alanyl-D-alanine carboxypeptidase n=1 Tax=Phyllobacterium pellucidum TaxID=2740464 RepID=A0A849VM44_9HYPH|nr:MULTISPECIES: D-alanyl-D-alanine carboxypeptidase family protein [Phyllobacterium]MRG54267.1 D-alanyl-D-alanine carboxypeptidase [Phyllobacterium sp. SYP-B3895]NTS30942.1 D-alanyl-D-alanine carboxypeptidase [Phyllobacterium pellucidum]UGY10456.1 D-alanyl-D-alanine carboxypeptidase [Phyllobacterium sp. T1018]SDP81786.1 D-alanyl-D-alanine carboxypeptidase [Phyllobacterium sp. YR620]SFI66567.1 D-alanyl-D-alanine carboxypeptidase [Phyllobacterium sp. CL33Tsu]